MYQMNIILIKFSSDTIILLSIYLLGLWGEAWSVFPQKIQRVKMLLLKALLLTYIKRVIYSPLVSVRLKPSSIFSKNGNVMQSKLRRFYVCLRRPITVIRKTQEGANITGDLLERLSYLLNIHATLRTVFSNPENVYGYMSMPNDNAYFDGRSPINVLESGSFANLYEVFRRIDALKSTGW